MQSNKNFGWAIAKWANGPISNDVPQVTVFTFTARQDAEQFKAKHTMLANCEIHASYEMKVPPFGAEGRRRQPFTTTRIGTSGSSGHLRRGF